MKAGERRELVLAAIVTLTEERGFPPTVREIGARVGLPHPSSVIYHLDNLVAEGRIEIVPMVARGIRVLARVRGAA